MAGGGPGRLQGHLALNLGGQVTWRKPEQRTHEPGSRGHGPHPATGQGGPDLRQIPSVTKPESGSWEPLLQEASTLALAGSPWRAWS